MDDEFVQESLRDVAAGILTPFDTSTSNILLDKLESNVQTLCKAGLSTFLACANISEYHSLSHAERIEVTKCSVESVSDDECIIAGIGGSTKTACELARAYEEIGVDALMLMPPTHSFTHERGFASYVEKIAATTKLGLVPYVKGYDPSIELLERITQLERVVGVKYANPDLSTFARAVDTCRDDIVWIEGMAEPLAPAYYLEGAEGFTAGVSNFVPELGVKLMTALREHDWDRARELRNATLSYQSLRSETGDDNSWTGANNIPAVKYGLDLAGMYGGPVREPLIEISEHDKRRCERYYEEIQSVL